MFFRGKFSLFLAFLLFFALTVGFEWKFLRVHMQEPVVMFEVTEIVGDVDIRRGDKLTSVKKGELSLTNGDSLVTHVDASVVVEVNGDGYIALGSNSVLKLDQLKVFRKNQYESLENARLYLESGRLWINNVFNPVAYNVYTNKVLVIPGNAIFEMDYNGSLLKVYNNQHDLNIGLLAKPYSELSRAGELNDLFYNYFFLPEGNRIEIAEAKVSEKLATLLLSKLIKEFPVSLVLKEDLDQDEWYTANAKRDLAVVNEHIFAYIESLSDTFVFNKLNDLQELYLLHVARNQFPLVFSEKKAEESKAEFLAHVFDIGQTWNLVDDPRKSDRNSEQFYSLWQSSLGFLDFDAREYLDSELSELQGVLHTSVLYPGKERVWDSSFAELRDQKDHKALIALLSNNLEEVYDLIDQAEYSRALEAFTQWSARMNLFLGSYNKDDLVEFYPDVETIRQNVTNLFFRYSDFYAQDYFDVLTYVDQKVIELSPDKLEQEENRQTMIQDRIKILKKLSFLIQNGKIDRQDGIELGLAMLANVKTLRNQALYRVAIYDYFESEIAEQDLLFEFYASPEYALLKGSFDEAFGEFQARQADWAALQDYVKQIAPKRKVKRVDSDELLADVYQQFVERDIFPDSLGVVGDEQNRLFEIKSGKVGQQDFSGMFDNKTKLIYDIQVSDQLLSKGIHIDKLREVVNSINLVDKEASDTEATFGEEFTSDVEYSSAEDLAVTLAIQELNSQGFFISKADVEIIDLLDNRFYVEDVALDEFAYTVSFEFDNTSDELTKMVVKVVTKDVEAGSGTKTEEIRLDGVFTTESLAEVLEEKVDEILDDSDASEASAKKSPGKVKRKVKR